MPESLRRGTTWPVIALVLLVLVVAGTIAYAVNHERGVRPASFSDAVKNQQIIDRLTPYPGARQTQKFVRESYGGYGQGLVPSQEVTSHSTTITYSLPAGTRPKQVTTFYERQLRGWHREHDGNLFPCGNTPARDCSASFTKGEGRLSISVDRRRRKMSLLVDHRGASSGYYGGGD